ncbi:MAG: hypothetical protein K6E16_03940 [Lachnospiraceae bacterium]|nr:hypothetical protein [Lachnospiraceae bacterium]
MLKKRILTRLTRLGLAMYVMTYCMAFTVCASENPIADMAVTGSEELLAGPEDPEPVVYAEPEETTNDPGTDPIDEPVPDENTTNPENSTDPVEIGGIAKIAFNETVLVFTAAGSRTVTLDITEGAESATFFADNLTVGLAAAADSTELSNTYKGAELSSLSAQAITLTVPDSMPYSTFYIVANYNNGTETLKATCKVVTHLDVAELDLDTNEEQVNGIINYSNLSANAYVQAMPKDLDAPYDADRFSWTVTEDGTTVASNRGVSYAPVAETPNVLNISFAGLRTPGIFNVTATYNNSFAGPDGTVIERDPVSASVFYNVTPYCYDVELLEMNDYSEPVTPGSNLTFVLQSKSPQGALLDPSRVEWFVYDHNSGVDFSHLNDEVDGVSIEGKGTEALVRTKNAKPGAQVGVLAIYWKTADHSRKQYITSTLYIENSVEDTFEAHLPEQTMKMQIFNVNNTMPLVIRDQNGVINAEDYNITEVYVVGEAPSFVDVYVADDGQSVNFNVSKSFVQDLTPESYKSIKNTKAKFPLTVGVSINGSEPMTLLTENISMTFATDGPVVKANPVTLDYYDVNSEDGTEVTFTGAKVGRIADIMTSSSSSSAKGIYAGENNTLRTWSDPGSKYPGLPKSGKGTYKFLAFINDSAYNLPDDYNVTVSVSYTIVNTMPTVTLGSSAAFLNPATLDTQNISFLVVGAKPSTGVVYEVLDSANKPCDALEVQMVYTQGDPSGHMCIIPKNVTYGKKYKVNLCPCRVRSDGEWSWIVSEGVAKTVTVSTPTKANSEKPSITFKTKGGIDASIPHSDVSGVSELELTLTGKNFNLYGRNVTFSSQLTNGTDITELLEYDYNSKTGLVTIFEKEAFTLLSKGYAGKQFKTTVTYPVQIGGMNTTQTATSAASKIAQSAVTPKLDQTTVSINPAYNDADIETKVINLPGGIFNYSVTLDCGRGVEVPFGYEFYTDYNYSLPRDVIQILMPANMSELKPVYGKTCTVKITPVLPNGVSGSLNGKPATFKISVLDPQKSKVTMTAKATGKLDAIRDDTYVNVDVSFKNLFDLESLDYDVDCTQIYQKKGKEIINFTDCFDVDCDGTNLQIWREYDENLTAGSYKADIVACVEKLSGEEINLTTTITFTVIRGAKTGAAIATEGKLVNRDYNRAVKLSVDVKDPTVNEVVKVESGNKIYQIMKVSEGIYKLGFADPAYVEKSGNKPITKAVTKTVPISVYYNGSTVPDKVNVKIITEP